MPALPTCPCPAAGSCAWQWAWLGVGGTVQRRPARGAPGAEPPGHQPPQRGVALPPASSFCQATRGGFALESHVCLQMNVLIFAVRIQTLFSSVKQAADFLSFSSWQTHNVTCGKEICISVMLDMGMKSISWKLMSAS